MSISHSGRSAGRGRVIREAASIFEPGVAVNGVGEPHVPVEVRLARLPDQRPPAPYDPLTEPGQSVVVRAVPDTQRHRRPQNGHVDPRTRHETTLPEQAGHQEYVDLVR